MLQAINEAVSFIRHQIKEVPETAVILGSGLGNIVDHLKVECTIDYEAIQQSSEIVCRYLDMRGVQFGRSAPTHNPSDISLTSGKFVYICIFA